MAFLFDFEHIFILKLIGRTKLIVQLIPEVMEHLRVDGLRPLWFLKLSLGQFIPVAYYSKLDAKDRGKYREILTNGDDAEINQRKCPVLIKGAFMLDFLEPFLILVLEEDKGKHGKDSRTHESN